MAYSPGKENGDPLYDAGYKPSRNYGLWIIDRTDGSLKVYNCSKKILMMFKEWDSIKNVRPWDAEKGVDWVISKKKTDGKWQYNATPVEETPLTPEEIERVKQTLEEKPLVNVFKPHTPEELQEMLDSYKSNPEGPTPGTGKWYKARREAANGGASTGGVNFDDDKNAADISDDSDADASGSDDSYDQLFDEEQTSEASGGTSLF